ncbi:MAG: hypothetical protein SXQ77_00865 [Halobacteria archaeon]|nr:hypothetical protein [Halobacteria archaeon]
MYKHEKNGKDGMTNIVGIVLLVAIAVLISGFVVSTFVNTLSINKGVRAGVDVNFDPDANEIEFSWHNSGNAEEVVFLINGDNARGNVVLQSVGSKAVVNTTTLACRQGGDCIDNINTYPSDGEKIKITAMARLGNQSTVLFKKNGVL